MAHEEFRPNYLQGALAHLIEECGEVLAAAGKIGRFGFDSVNPLIPVAERETNADWLLREMADLEKAIYSLREMMGRTGHVSTERPDLSLRLKRLMRQVGTATVTVSGMTQECLEMDELVRWNYARLVRAERHPTGQRDYALTAVGLAVVGLLSVAA